MLLLVMLMVMTMRMTTTMMMMTMWWCWRSRWENWFSCRSSGRDAHCSARTRSSAHDTNHVQDNDNVDEDNFMFFNDDDDAHADDEDGDEDDDDNNALCSYPHVNVPIRDLSQTFTTALIFQQSHYFRQKYLEITTCAVSLLNNIWVRVEHSLLQQLNLQRINCSSSSLQAGCE